MVPECSWYIACFVDVSRKIPACIDCSNAGITVSVVRQARCLQQQRNWGTPHMYHSNWLFYLISINYFPIHIYSFIYCWGVLDDQKVWGDDGSMPGIAYIDSQDVSRMMASAMIKDRLPGKAQDIVSPLCYNSMPYYCAHIIWYPTCMYVYRYIYIYICRWDAGWGNSQQWHPTATCFSPPQERTVGQTLTLTGPKVWSTNDVIKLCEARARAGEHMRLTWQMNMIYIYTYTI